MGPAQSPLVSEITLYELPATALNHLTNEPCTSMPWKAPFTVATQLQGTIMPPRAW